MIQSKISCNVQDTLSSLHSQNIKEMIHMDMFGLITVTKKSKIKLDGFVNYSNEETETIMMNLQQHADMLYSFETSNIVSFKFFDLLLSPIREFHQYKVFAFCLRFDKMGYSSKDLTTFKFIFTSKYKEILLDYELVNEHNYLKKIFESVTSLIITIDTSNIITSVNKRAEDLFNSKNITLIGKSLFTVLPDLHSNKIKKVIEGTILTKRNFHLTDEIVHTENGVIFIDWTFLPHKEVGGEVTGIILIGIDKTRQKIYELEIEQLKQFSMLGELATGLAHDIKNPLTSIRGCSRILEKKLQKNKECLSFITPIIDEVDRINSVIEQLLSYSFITQKENYSTIDINEVIEKCINVSKFHIKFKNINLIHNLTEGLPLIKANNVQLQQAFLNILFNAIQAIDTIGNIIITTSHDSKCEKIIVAVEDDGKGIPQNAIQKIFDPLYTTKDTGNGIGLSIAKRVFDKLKAEISVTSRENEGTTFTIAFPY